MRENKTSERRSTARANCPTDNKYIQPLMLVAEFEGLWVWQKAIGLMKEIHLFCKTLPRDETFKIKNQIERSSSSVCDNIAEGHSAYYYNEKIKGFNIARKEAGETQNQTRQLTIKGYLKPEQSQNWVERYEEVIKGINGYVRYVRKKKDAGNQGVSRQPDTLIT